MKVSLLTFFILFIFNASSQQVRYSEAVIPKTDYNYSRIIGVFNDTIQVWNTGLNTVPTIYIYNKNISLIRKVSIPVKKFAIYQLIKYKSFYYAFVYPLDKKEALIILKISASGNINTLSGEKIIGLSYSTKAIIEIQKNKSDMVLLQRKEDADAGNKMMLTTYDSLFNKKDEISLQYKNEKEKLSSFFVRIPSADNCFIIRNNFSLLEGSELTVTHINFNSHLQTQQTITSDEYQFFNPEILPATQTGKYYLYSNIAALTENPKGTNLNVYITNLDTLKKEDGKIIQVAGSLPVIPSLSTRSTLSYLAVEDSFIYAVFHYSMIRKASQNNATPMYYYEAPPPRILSTAMDEYSMLDPVYYSPVAHSYGNAEKIYGETVQNNLKILKFDTAFKILSNYTIEPANKENIRQFSGVLNSNILNEFSVLVISIIKKQNLLSIYTFNENGLKNENLLYANPKFTYHLKTVFQYDASNFYAIFSDKKKQGIVRINVNSLQKEP